MTAMRFGDCQADLDTSVAARRVRRGDASDYLGFLHRVLRAYSGRVLEGDVDDLTQLITLRSEVDRLIADTVATLRRHPYGLTWTQIAAATGTTRQAAQQRDGRPPDATAKEGSWRASA
jgi:hypothetical protein